VCDHEREQLLDAGRDVLRLGVDHDVGPLRRFVGSVIPVNSSRSPARARR
jgi:hypothetical protein